MKQRQPRSTAEPAEIAERILLCALGVLCGSWFSVAHAQVARTTRVAVLEAEDRRAPTPRELAIIRAAARSGDDQTARVAVRALGETYGVHFDAARRDEVVARVDRLQLPSYTGFVMPTLTAVRDAAGEIVDVEISYPLDLTIQMLEYSAATRHLRARP